MSLCKYNPGVFPTVLKKLIVRYSKINKEMVVQQARIASTTQDINNQQKIMDNAQETLDFLTTKYSNDQLYAYLEGSVRTTFYQMYTIAYDLAKKVEATYLFERGPQVMDASKPFIRFGYWDPSHDGLQCGEALAISLRQLQSTYLESRGYDFEITKNVSLRQLSPLALMHLRQSGSCDFTLPEVLFDIDFPGHYLRRIRSVALTIPAVAGQSRGDINATLTLTQNGYRITSSGATDANSYPEKAPDGPDGADPRFSSSKVPINSIAVGNGQNDSGTFELTFNSERYLPFEGAGAISSWQLELPQQLRSFDYTSIPDVVLSVKYTSVDGGAALKSAAAASVTKFIKTVEDISSDQGLFASFDLAVDFASEWAKASAGPSAGTNPPTRIISMPNIGDLLPYFTRSYTAQAQDIALVTDMALTADSYSLKTSASTSGISFSEIHDDQIGSAKLFRSAGGLGVAFQGPNVAWKLEIRDPGTPGFALKKIWLLVRFTLR